MDPNVEGWKSIADEKQLWKVGRFCPSTSVFPGRASTGWRENRRLSTCHRALRATRSQQQHMLAPPGPEESLSPGSYFSSPLFLHSSEIPFFVLLWDPFLDHLQKVQICAGTPVRSLWMFKIQKNYPFFENPICNSSANQCNAEDFACRSMSPVCLSLVALIHLQSVGFN